MEHTSVHLKFSLRFQNEPRVMAEEVKVEGRQHACKDSAAEFTAQQQSTLLPCGHHCLAEAHFALVVCR